MGTYKYKNKEWANRNKLKHRVWDEVKKLSPDEKLRYLSAHMRNVINKYPEVPKWKTFDNFLYMVVKQRMGKDEVHGKLTNNGSCGYCNQLYTEKNPKTRDHIKPKSLGYSINGNGIDCCIQCNHWKADKSILEWRREVEFILNAKQNKSISLPIYSTKRIKRIMFNLNRMVKK